MQQIKKLSKTAVFFAIFFACNLVCLHTYAQLSLGFEAGYHKNYLVTNNANRTFTNYQPRNGFSAGIPIQYKIADWFAVAIDPELIQKNYSQVRSGFFAGVYEDTRNTYIQLPLMARFIFGGRQLKGFVNTGAYGGYWAASRIKGQLANIVDQVNKPSVGNIYDTRNSYNYNEKYGFKSKDKRFEAGWLAGMGISLLLKNRYDLFSEARMLYSFTDQQKNYMIGQVPRYNTTYGIHTGILIHLHKTPTTR